MVNEENDEEEYSPRFIDKLKQIDRMYARNEYTYLDSDEVENILDHLLLMTELDKAIWLIKHSIVHFPINERIGIRYAEILTMNGEGEKALLHLHKLEEIEPNNAEILQSIADVYSRLHNTKKAIEYYEKTLANTYDEEDEEFLSIDLAIEYKIRKDYRKAIAVLKKVFDRGTRNNFLMSKLNEFYAEIKEEKKAIECSLQFLDENPYSMVTWLELGLLYKEIDNSEKAIWAFEFCVAIDDTFNEAIFELASAYMDIEEYRKALVYLNDYLKLNDEDPLPFIMIGECYEALNEIDTAYRFYLKGSQLMPSSDDAWLGRGKMNNLLGKYPEAIQELLVVVNLDVNRFEGWLSLGNAYENNGEDKLALEAYQKAFELAPDEDEVIVDYLSFLAAYSVEEVIKIINANAALEKHKVCLMILCYCHWELGDESESMLYFEQILENDVKLAEDLFECFPEMKEVNYFIDRLQEFEENDNE